MADIAKALWLIETRLAGEISLGALAAETGATATGLARTFALVTGRPVMRYARGRRLSEAARRLADGASSITEVALDAGYGSHEAFTRAFRREFGLTPEGFRANGRLASIELTEPIRMTQDTLASIAPTRIAVLPPFRIAGLRRHIESGRFATIAALWQEFSPHIGHLPGEVPGTAYGACIGGDAEAGIDYLAGVAVTGGKPEGFETVEVPGGRAAVFRHAGNVATIQETFAAIFGRWLPASGEKVGPGPVLEVYGPGFDPASGEGGFEIRVPLEG